MKKKISNAFLLMFMMQLMLACCPDKTKEVTINGVKSRALILDGINYVEFDKQNPINKEDLIIEIILTEAEKIASSELNKSREKDTKVLKAAVVPCGEQTVIYKNKLESVKVELLDIDNNNARIDITEQMVIQGTQQSIPTYIAENNPSLRGFLIEFSDTSNLPDRISYVIEATLDDGSKFSLTVGIIQFN